MTSEASYSYNTRPLFFFFHTPCLPVLAALEVILVAGADGGGITASGVHEPGTPVLATLGILRRLFVACAQMRRRGVGKK